MNNNKKFREYFFAGIILLLNNCVETDLKILMSAWSWTHTGALFQSNLYIWVKKETVF